MRNVSIAVLTMTLYCVVPGHTFAQSITEANKCYEEKKYDCAVTQYKQVLAAKSYQEKDLSTIQFRIGYGLHQLNNHREAIPYLNAAMVARPEWGSPVWETASAYYKLDSFQKAYDFYRKAIEFYKKDSNNLKRLYYWAGNAQFSLKRYSAALGEYRAAYRIDSTLDYVTAALADASYHSGDYTAAKRYYIKSINYGLQNNYSNRDMATRYYWYGQSLYNLKEYENAKTMLEKAASLGFNSRSISWGLGGINFGLKNYREAVDHYTRAINESKADDSSSLKSLHYWRGRGYSELKDYAKAQSDLALSIKYDAAYRFPYNEQGNILRKTKKYKESIAVYDKSIERFRTSYVALAEFHHGRGLTYLELKDTVLAKSDFLFSLEYDSKYDDPRLQLGHLAFSKKSYSDALYFYRGVSDKMNIDSSTWSQFYFRKGYSNLMGISSNLSEAREDLTKSIRFDSLNKLAHQHLADVYYRQSNWVLAEKHLDYCIKLYEKEKDSLATMYRYRGIVRSKQNKFKETLEDYQQAVKIKPSNDPADYQAMGQLAFELKDYTLAITYFNKLISVCKPENKNELLFGYYARGRCYYEQKKKTSAVTDLQKALELEPNSPDVKTWLNKAQQLP